MRTWSMKTRSMRTRSMREVYEDEVYEDVLSAILYHRVCTHGDFLTPMPFSKNGLQH